MLWLKLIHVSKRNPVRRHALCNPGRRIFCGISVSKCIYNECSSWYRFLVTFTLAEGGHMHGPFHLFSHQSRTISPLRWRHNDHDGVSNHQPHGCLLNRLFRRRSKKHQSSASLAFVWGIHRDRWIPRTTGQLRGKCFHLMTSSCLLAKIYQSYCFKSVTITRVFLRFDSRMNSTMKQSTKMIVLGQLVCVLLYFHCKK